ncbi:MAG: glycosyltransferase N-terminal domain-containing protein [Bacteroidaceae bacterium]|nr:glycosyltransferase N-terminal domain-containing protein [Bacteroidaceae bacterium]
MLYTIGIFFYMVAVHLAALFNRKARLMVRGQWNTWHILRKQLDKSARYVWFHAASLGEFEQGRPMMERLRREHPEYKIILTFFSPSGYEVRKHYEGADIVCYLPFDIVGNAHAFIHMVKPEMVFFIKYEFWYNYIRHLHHRGVPVYSVCSIFRPGNVFFKWYGFFYAPVLRHVTHYFVQDERSRRLLALKGLKNVSIVGDTRMDRVLAIKEAAKELPLVEQFKGDKFVLVAGSSWAPDEDLILNFFNAHPEMKLILAPHVIDEAHLQQIVQKVQRPVLRWSKATAENVASADCLIIDCFGLLSSIYRYGEVAYVGGGFGVGIHNVPEAAVYGVPVLIGPNNKKFREARDLLRMGGCLQIHDQDDFDATLLRLMTDPDALRLSGLASRKYIRDNAGATDKIMQKLGL